jgi:hypothetical protein
MTRKHKRDASGGATTPDETLLRQLEVAGEVLELIEAGKAPTLADLAAAPRLDWWCIAEDSIFPVLQGVVTGHPRLSDGAFVATSPLLWLADDGSAARTLNRFYRLGPRLGQQTQSH